MEAIRDHSESRGAARTVGFVLASYADKYGNGIYVGLDRIMAEAKVNRKSAVDGRRFFLENGEAELVDRPDDKPLMKGRVRVMSMAPLMERARAAEAKEGAATEPLSTGAPTEPQQKEGAPSELSGVRSERRGVRSVPPSGSPSEPDTEGSRTETELEPEDARAGAHDDPYPDHDVDDRTPSALSPASFGPVDPPPAQLAAERRKDEKELADVEALLAARPTDKLLNGRRDELLRSLGGNAPALVEAS
jgi:hypothetical protein